MFASETQMLISSLGWALVHFLWQGTLITFAYWAISRSINSIHVKYWTGMGMVILSLIVPVININSGTVVASTEEILVPLSNTVISYQQLDYIELLLYFINESLPYIVSFWAVIVLFLSARLIRSWMQLAAIKHECDPKISCELKQYVKNVAIKLDLSIIPFLKVSQRVLVPAAYGIFKPTVLLPLSLLSQIPRNQLEAIIKHELCHLKRNDFIHNIIQLFADIVLFFHPGIRWMNNDIRHVREQCCDQLVLSQDTETITYAKALANIAAFTNDMSMKHSVHIGINDGLLLNRVKFLLQNKSSQSSLMVFIPFIILIAFAFILLQPNNSLNENSALNPTGSEKVFISDPNQFDKYQQKRITSQNFYPKLNQIDKTSNQDLTNYASINDRVNEPVQIDRYKPSTTKAQLQAELAQSMKLQIIDTNLFKNEITTFTPNIETTDLVSQPVTTSSSSIIKSAEDPTKPLLLEQVTNLQSETALESFENTDSISLSFKQFIAPKYPQNFWLKQYEQDVITTFRILPNGRVYDIKFNSQRNNFVAFEQAVEKAMKNWRFEVDSLNDTTLQRTYQQIFSFNISKEAERNCNLKSTGTRIGRDMPCNK